MRFECLLSVGVVAALGARQELAVGAEYRSAATGNWHAAVSWEVLVGGTWQPATTPPACGDTATILNGHVIIVNCTSSSISGLVVAAGGGLEIDGCSSTQRAVLTVCGSGPEPSVSIAPTDGLQLMDRYSELRLEATTTISGSGSLKGLDSDAVIAIAPSAGTDVTLTSSVTIHGALTIRAIGGGDGFFVNAHKVWADKAGEAITLDSSLAGITDTPVVDPCGFFRWEVSTAHAILRFDRGSEDLAGSFWVGPGRLVLDEDVKTTGNLMFKHGGIIRPSLLPPACFWFGGHCDGSDCPCPRVCSPICVLTICL